MLTNLVCHRVRCWHLFGYKFFQKIDIYYLYAKSTYLQRFHENDPNLLWNGYFVYVSFPFIICNHISLCMEGCFISWYNWWVVGYSMDNEPDWTFPSIKCISISKCSSQLDYKENDDLWHGTGLTRMLPCRHKHANPTILTIDKRSGFPIDTNGMG